MGFIRYLFQVSRLDNKQEYQSDKNKTAHSVRSSTVVEWLYIIGIAMIVLSFFQLVLAFLANLSEQILVMCLLTIAGYAMAGIFLVLWSYNMIDSKKYKRLFQVVLILVFIYSLLRGLFSAKMTFSLLHGPYPDFAYYIAEVPVWLAFSLFLAAIYFKKFASETVKIHSRMLRFIAILIAVFGALRALLSVYFVVLYFHPRSLVWVFYVADAVVWFAIVFFFSLYARSHLVSRHHRR